MLIRTSPKHLHISIKFIGAGFPRTGTNTLRESLEVLGLRKTYHMKQLLVNPENLHYWLTLKLTGPTDWAKLYNGYEATVDFPCYPWYGAYEIILWCKNYSNSKTF